MSEWPPLRWNVVSSTCRFFPAWSGLRLCPAGLGRRRIEIEWEGHPSHPLCEVEFPDNGQPGAAVSFGGVIVGPEGERFRVWATLCPGDGEDGPRSLCGSLRPLGGIGASGGTGVWVAEEDRPPGGGSGEEGDG